MDKSILFLFCFFHLISRRDLLALQTRCQFKSRVVVRAAVSFQGQGFGTPFCFSTYGNAEGLEIKRFSL